MIKQRISPHRHACTQIFVCVHICTSRPKLFSHCWRWACWQEEHSIYIWFLQGFCSSCYETYGATVWQIKCDFVHILKQDQREPPSWKPVHRSCIHLNQCTDVLLSWETCLLSCNHGLSDSRQMKKSIPSFLHVQPFLYRQLSRVFQYSGCMHLALLNQEKVPCFANTA